MTEYKPRVLIYQTIINDIKHKIANKEYQPHEYLGTQIELAQRYATSEITSKRALLELTNQGLIYRVKGKGTFISGHAQPEQERESPATYQPHTISHIYFIPNLEMPADLFNPLISNRFFIELISSIQQACRKMNTPFAFIPTVKDVISNDPDAAFIVLLTPNAFQADYIDFFDNKRSFVTVHGYFPHLSIPYVVSDNLAGGYLATQHLISQNHRDIAIVLTGNSRTELNQEFSQRLQGYKLAMQQHQLPIKEEYIVVMEQDYEQAGFYAMEQLIRLPKRPTAVFFSTDSKAHGGIYACLVHKLQIPQDISIVGYDDQYFSAEITPALTTINQNAKRIGQRAVELLFENFGAENRLNLKEEITPSLIIRNTVAAPNPFT